MSGGIMEIEQLELLPLTEIDRLNEKLLGQVNTTDNLRRGMFARHDALFKMYNELKNEVEQSRKEIAELRVRLSAFQQSNFIPQAIQGLELKSKRVNFRL